MTIRLGSHVDATDPISGATERGIDVVQIFIGDPTAWKGAEVAYPRGAAGLREDAAAAGIDIFVHAPYVINVASANNRIRIPSRKLLQQQLTAAAEIGAAGLIVHGGHVAGDASLEQGFDNWHKAIAGLDIAVPLLIENTAGGSRAMTRYFDTIGRLWEAISTAPGFSDVGFCLDTCHAHAAGEDLVGVTQRVRAITGRIDLVHINDSRDGFGSGADRHASLGQGQIDPGELIEAVATAQAPGVLETPGGPAEHRADLEWLRSRL